MRSQAAPRARSARSMQLPRLWPYWVLGLLLALTATQAAAVPSFAVQTGRPCGACHVGGFGPQLTPFGRAFKLGGYTLRTNTFNLPVSAMAVASFVHTAKDQAAPPAPSYGVNDNVAVDQISVFLAGGVGSHLGGFVQATYDGIGKAYSWDNLDLRAVTTLDIAKTNVLLGLDVNNAPTVQDVFNTLPSWGYPYTSSGLAPGPAASPLIANLTQTTLGVTAYAWINSQFYAEVGGYRSPSAQFLIHAGADPTSPGNIKGVAPYGRLAYQKNFGDRNVEVGAFAMGASLYPGHDQSLGLTDHYTDLGLDASYQLFAARKDVFTVNARYTHEQQRLDASQALGLAATRNVNLQDLRIDASYYWRDRIGLTVGAFDTWGKPDQLLYAANRTFTPDSSGLLFQLDGTPWGEGGSPLGPRFNMRLGIQYTAYLSFDGSGRNYDGLGDGAGANNTVRIFSWIAY